MSLFMSLSKDLRKTHCKRRETTNLDFPRQSHLTNCCSQKLRWKVSPPPLLPLDLAKFRTWTHLTDLTLAWCPSSSLFWPRCHRVSHVPKPCFTSWQWWECWGREEVGEVGMCIAFCQASVRCQALGMQREVPIMPARSEEASEICWHL